LFLTLAAADAQRPAGTVPQGNRIAAQDGDVIVVDNDARIRIIRRREAHVRAIFNAAERWLVILVDQVTAAGPPDGRVDMAYQYQGVTGEWPFDARWEGPAAIENYSMADNSELPGMALVTAQGTVQFLRPQRADAYRDPGVIAVLSFTGSGTVGSGGQSFDEAERWQVAQVRRNDGVIQVPPGRVGSGAIGWMTGPVITGVPGSSPGPAGAPVRVGGNIRTPAKITDVAPVMPEQAVRAGIRGVVILEVVIDTDGSVKTARVLRSIPLLDAAAVEAVRQWRFEPTMLNGQPVSVIMTVTVPFQ
jgi:TonB family protein